MRLCSLLILAPHKEPLWVRLYVRQTRRTWAAMIVGDEVLPLDPDELKAVAFFGGHRRRSGGRGKRLPGNGQSRDMDLRGLGGRPSCLATGPAPIR